jgi:membrane-associated phospholipid phosphatase
VTETRPAPRVAVRAVLVAGFLVAFTVLLIIVELKWGPAHRFDVRVARSLNRTEVDSPAQASWWRAVSNVLSPNVLRLLAALAAVVLWIRQAREAALFVVVAMVGAAVLEALGKALVGRARPVLADPVAHAAGNSFPSGHAMTSFVAFGVLAVLAAPRYRALAIGVGAVAVILVGFSRIALGVHYVTDVLGAWLLGAAWLAATAWLFDARAGGGGGLLRRRSARPAERPEPGRPRGR